MLSQSVVITRFQKLGTFIWRDKKITDQGNSPKNLSQVHATTISKKIFRLWNYGINNEI